MDSRFKYITVLVWDFDGTLYKPNNELWHDVRESEYRVIAEHTHWPREKVLKEFEAKHAPGTSATEAVATLSGITTVSAANEMETYYDRTKYLTRDNKLIELFSKLTGFRHLLLANGVRKNIEKAIIALGLTPTLFETIVTSELTGVNKPNPEPFEHVLGFTKFSPEQHLMIGDRIEIDLVPAKKLGMNTCLVWSNEKNPAVDVTIPTVYDIANLLG